ncbi:MAG: type I methionyl aminopeptidase [candidate division WOR-3 bacterium]|jgi:methionyl aminopeptidase|nr:type I methionyl aminopeptidase [candidate division WOR-3 bacterium]MCR4424431.1 type I methionyl aminopeptidase [candidate division WOR-3 bacterium]MDH7518249.1 type I methionyl aminopeptidase [bacterium]
MALYIKSPAEVEGIRQAGQVAAALLKMLKGQVAPGVSLKELEDFCARFIREAGAVPTFLGYRGFPAAVCISVNEEVVHGIPDHRVLNEGDIVKVDVGVTKKGFIADAARTYQVGKVAADVVRLVDKTEQAFYEGLRFARAGYRVGDISAAIQRFVEEQGFSVVRELHGHGVGIELHEEPTVPNFGVPGKGRELVKGMTIAIEPMVNMGSAKVKTLSNGWTVVAADGKPSAHYENTVLITDGEPEILTV